MSHASYIAFPDIHWQKIRTNNPLERLPIGRVPALLGMDSLEHMAHLADLGRRHVAEDIPVERHHRVVEKVQTD